jgi:hypothetical protein
MPSRRNEKCQCQCQCQCQRVQACVRRDALYLSDGAPFTAFLRLALTLALTLFPREQTIPILKRLGDWLGLRYE